MVSAPAPAPRFEDLEWALLDLRGLLWAVKILAETRDGDADHDLDAIARIANAAWSTADSAVALWTAAHAERTPA